MFRQNILSRTVGAALLLSSFVFTLPAHAVVKPKKAPASNYTKGQAQRSGGFGEFGVTYTTKDLWNIDLISAKYSVDFFDCRDAIFPSAKEKLVVVTFSIKNAAKTDNQFDAGNMFSAYDQHGKEYDMRQITKQSDLERDFSETLPPGQGVGQAALNDPCTFCFEIDEKSNLQKMIINRPRLGHSENVLRYYMSTATVAEDGAAGDPNNVIQGLPANEADPADKTGATPLSPLNGGKPGDGRSMPSGQFYFTVSSFGDCPAGTTVFNNPPDTGKKYVQAVISLSNAYWQDTSIGQTGTFDNTSPVVSDADGDTFPLVDSRDKFMMMSSDTEPPSIIAANAKRTGRYVFEVPDNVKLTTLLFGADPGRAWTVDISGS